MVQAQLFETVPTERRRARMSAEEAFREFHRENPRVYRMLVQRARQIKARGFQNYSIKTIWAVLRWHSDLGKDLKESYKLNDRYYSRFARLIEEKEPDLKGFFHFRKLRT